MFLTHALRAILRTAVATGDALWKYVSLLLSGTPPTQTFIADASVNANVLTLNGDVRPSNLNPYVEGYYSNFFDGSGDYLDLPNSTVFSQTGSWTLELWVFPTVAVNNYVYSQATTNFLQINIDATMKVNIDRSGVGNLIVSTNPISLGAWTHLALVSDGTNMKLFINGVQSGSTAAVGTQAASATVTRIGAYQATGTLAYQGYVSNLRLVKGTAVYTANFTPSTTPLTAVSGTSLLTCQSNRFIDNSANNFAITRTGDVAVRGFVPFTPPTTVNVNTLYSTYFDGTGDYLDLPSNAGLATGSSDFTLETWVYFNSISNSYVFSGSGATIQIVGGSLLTYDGSNKTIGTPVVGQWMHVAICRSGTTIKAFLNGVQGSSWTNSGAQYTHSSGRMGAEYGTGSQPLLGSISNYRLVVGTALYTANFTPPTAPLTAIANTSLLTCQNATLRDNSTNAFAITSFGQAQPDAISPFTQVTTPVTATYLGSGYFDGTGDYLTAPSSAAFAFGTGNFTIEFWVYFNTVAGTQDLIGNYVSNVSTDWIIIMSGTGIQFYPSGSSSYVYSGASSVTTNTWYHVAAVRSGSTCSLYVNGTSVGTPLTVSTTLGDATKPVYIGARSGPSSFFNGYIADVRVVKGTALYTANFAPPATPLTAVANTSLLTLQTDQPVANKQFIDNSGSNLPITQFGNSTQGAFSPYGSNWSNYFDGTGDTINLPTSTALLGAGNYTVEFWVNLPAAPTGGAYFTAFAWGSSGSVLRCFLLNETVTKLGIWIGATNVVLYPTSAMVGQWAHIALVRSGTTLTAYINGVSVATASDATNYNTGQLYIASQAATNFLTGYISNFRIVVGTAVYTAAFTPPTAPLTAVSGTSLLTCQSPSLVDNSINGFAITRNGDVSVQRFSPFSPVIQAPVSYSTYFDGSGDWLSFTGTTGQGLNFGTGDFTVELWYYMTNNTSNTTYHTFVRQDSSASGFDFGYRPSASQLLVGCASVGEVAVSTTLALNTWYHLSASRSGTNLRFFVNGVQAGTTATNSFNFSASGASGIGKNAFNNAYTPYGYISNVRAVKQAVYTTAFTPPTAPLTAISGTSLLTCQSPTIVDNSSNAFELTGSGNAIARLQNPFGFTNTTTGTAYTPALYGGSAYFDGTGDYLSSPYSVNWMLSGNFTIECWLYWTAHGSYGGVVGCANSNTSTGITAGWYLDFNSSTNNLQFEGQGGVSVVTTNAIPSSQWVHIAVVRSGSTITHYLNGVANGSGTSSTSFDSVNNPLYVGVDRGGSSTITGYIADVRITKGQALYTGGFVPPIAPLQAVKNTVLLLNMDKSGITDSSRNVDLETVGDAKIRYESPYSGNYYSNYFDGTGDWLTYTGGTTTTLSGDYTVEAWLNLSSLTTSQPFFCIGDDYNLGLGFFINTSGKISLFGNNVSIYTSTGATVVAGVWTHIAIVRSGTTITGYINGIAQSTSTNSAQYSGTFTQIGREVYNTGTGVLYTGYISNLRLVKGTAVYTANFTPSTTPLTAVSGTSLLTCQSKSFVDNSSNNFTITRNGDVAVRSLNPFQANIANSSMYFDGTGDSLKAPYNPSYSLPGDFTVESWVYLTSAGGTGNQTIASFGYLNSTGTGPWGFYLNGTGPYTLYFNSSAGNKFTSTTVAIPVGTWNHVTYCRSGSTGRFFVNGTIVGTTISDTFTYSGTTESLYVGTMGDGATAPINGYLADFRITKSARYTANFTPPTAPLPTA